MAYRKNNMPDATKSATPDTEVMMQRNELDKMLREAKALGSIDAIIALYQKSKISVKTRDAALAELKEEAGL